MQEITKTDREKLIAGVLNMLQSLTTEQLRSVMIFTSKKL